MRKDEVMRSEISDRGEKEFRHVVGSVLEEGL